VEEPHGSPAKGGRAVERLGRRESAQGYSCVTNTRDPGQSAKRAIVRPQLVYADTVTALSLEYALGLSGGMTEHLFAARPWALMLVASRA
jgi:hypothetical protein